MSTDVPSRKRPFHFPPVECGNRSIIVFLTLCTRNRQPILARPEVHGLLRETWQAASHWLIGRYVVMPDHIHLFCAPNGLALQSLSSWISYWRNQVSRRWTNQTEKPLWQKDYWDRQLRLGDSYAHKWDYVRGNPIRHGLATRIEDWPFQGELNLLRWHDR